MPPSTVTPESITNRDASLARSAAAASAHTAAAPVMRQIWSAKLTPLGPPYNSPALRSQVVAASVTLAPFTTCN